MSTVVTIVIAVLGALDITTLIMFFINRHDNRKNLGGKLTVLEKDVLRTQLLMLILLRPEAKQEILTIGEHYFRDLKGNWYMTGVFNQWLTETDVLKPEWFDKEG